ncbi:MAG: hypothetical protein LQ345_003089, partial [Seirophora villosa]
MKITASIIIGAAVLGAKLATAAPFVERQDACLPDGWCDTDNLPASVCCSGNALDKCCLPKRDALPREVATHKGLELTGRDLVAAPAVKKRAKKPCPPPPPPPPPATSTNADGTTLSLGEPVPLLSTPTITPLPLLPPVKRAELLTTRVPASQATPHVSTPVVTAHPVSSPQATIIHHFGPGWDHILAHHPLPTTLATVVGKKRATPPLCVAGANCSQG